jgi:uncharacterized membrane protein
MKRVLTPASLLLGLSIALVPTIASAQFNSGFGNSGDNRDPFSRASGGDTSGLMQLINQAQLNGQTNPNYSRDQQDQLNSASSDFRARQIQSLRERNKKVPVTNSAPPKHPQPKSSLK